MWYMNEMRGENCTHILLPIYHSEFGLSYTIAMVAGLQNTTGSTPRGRGGWLCRAKIRDVYINSKRGRERERERKGGIEDWKSEYIYDGRGMKKI